MDSKQNDLQELYLTFRKNKLALVGLILSVGIILTSILAPWIAPYDPLEQHISIRLTGPTQTHLLGTDQFGRDVLSRIIFGSRVSLLIGIGSLIFGAIIGITLGLIAGFNGGGVENAIMRSVDFFMSFPTLLLGLLILSVLGSGLIQLIIGIGVCFVPRFARLTHGPTLSLREQDFIVAARSIGRSTGGILIKHILPNVFAEVLVMGTLWVGMAIRVEASLSFLGFGISPPTPTWGNMIRAGVGRLTNAPWTSLAPGIAILITILAFNMMGDGLRDISDPKLRGA